MTIYKSPFGDIKSKSNKTVFDFLFVNNPKIDLNSNAIIDAETSEITTYRQLISNSLSFASGFQSVAGLYPGSTVLIFSPNISLYPTLLFASLAAGICATTANAGYTINEFSHQLKDGGASVILVGSDLVDVVKGAARETGFDLEKVYVLPGIDGVVREQGLKSFELLRGSDKFVPVQIDEKDLDKRIAFLPYSSGTTSRPKGVEITHSNITSVMLQLNNSSPGLFDRKEIVMGVLPLYHIYGLIVLLCQSLHNGGTLVLLPKFELQKFCQAVQTYHATVALIVPPIALGLAKAPEVESYNLSSLRFILSGAAPLSRALQERLEERLERMRVKEGKQGGFLGFGRKKTSVVQGFGMSETTAVALLPDLNQLKPGTCGKLLSNVEARLVSTESGKDINIDLEGEEGSGELWLRGPNMMVRYHGNPKATAETVNSEGWLLTGDICTLERSTGLFTVVDRSKELVKYNGFQLIPSELEGILLTCPYVADAAVIGVWEEERATELARAYVVVEKSFENEEGVLGKIQDFVAGQVAPHKKLRGGVFKLDVIPKSAAGKILRKDLRVLAAQEKKEGSSKL